jgi:3'(2'), 5'-bisphosphate nucleotidase
VLRDDDHVLAAELAGEAGRALVDLRGRSDLTGRALGAAGDRLAHDLIAARLREARAADALLSEEGAEDLARLDAARTWIVDPLDGTREYGEVPRTDWAVHVALVIDGAPDAGAVALPARNLVLATEPAPAQPAEHDGPPRVVVSRSRPPAQATAIAHALSGVLVELGSAGAKAMAVVLGDADVYAHAGGQYEWDSCAPVAVAAAAGLHVSRLDGSPLRYNNRDPYLPDLLICRPSLAPAVIAAARSGGA